uniref:Putative endonuclease n=1 Tax=Candidatus Kentrum sp. FW TaxID=2126338 RepID=A0A450T4Q8_9GAMM|nr:MAG: putative endonuclease [Candidatus Kentron sp. FW]
MPRAKPNGDLVSKQHRYFVYLLTNWDGMMHVGVTGDFPRRIYEQKNKLMDGFTKKYNVNKLAYFEETGDVNAAIMKEKEIKKWRRENEE